MATTGDMITLTTSDGFTLDAYIAEPEGEAKGGLVVIQEIFGLTEQLKSVARAYAGDGYETIVPALFDRVSPRTVVPFDDPDAARALMMRLDGDAVLRDVQAAIKRVDRHRGVSLLGFCWGGGQALRIAGLMDLTSAVSYYGTRLTGHLGTPPKCPMLFHFGDADTMHSPPEVIQAVRDALPGAECHVYAAGHAFANDTRKTYVPEAAIPARERTLAFLDRHHAGSAS